MRDRRMPAGRQYYRAGYLFKNALPDSLSGHNDHRIVMALAALCTMTGGVIEGAEAVKKSFPDFFEKIGKAGIILQGDETIS